MSRLADYFIVVGYNHEKDKQGVSDGKIVQRFPACDWDDAPFIDGIELFCQPQGWCLSSQRMEPRFFVCVLTDVDAGRHYCACLTFNETVTIQPSRPVDEEDETFGMLLPADKAAARSQATINHHCVMYAPKALVLVSRFDCFSIFRNCLGILYAVYSDNMQFELEKLVGNIIGGIQIPPTGGAATRFSIGAGDRQCYQPPSSSTLPTTGISVAQLFHQLGIRQSITLFSAVMTEVKILVHSCSYWRLMETCRALTSLMYPFKYSYVYIPVLPTMLSEVVTTPTPFIMGVHTMALENIPELLDVVVVDLDGGCLTVPEAVTIPPLPLFIGDTCYALLSHLLFPDLHAADHAFSSKQERSSDLVLDKEIRAVFLRMFAQLLQGYRNCLTLVRIHPSSVITFHKASFLGQRGLVECPFTTRLLECMFFNVFVSERGVPWRQCDLFDEIYCCTDRLPVPAFDTDALQYMQMTLEHVKELAECLLRNEDGNEQQFAAGERMPRPTAGSHTRIHQPVFPLLDADIVQRTIDQSIASNMLKSNICSAKITKCCIVPMGAEIAPLNKDSAQIQGNSARRLEVLRNCINCIFEGKISDARKSLPAVLRALRHHPARLVLCHELSHHVVGTRAVLDSEQFDLVVRLLNCALQDDSNLDEYGVAAAILPLASTFCRKLSTGVIQFAFTCLQDHMVWQNLQFWQSAYYADVERDICKLYSSPADELRSAVDAGGSQCDHVRERIPGLADSCSGSAFQIAAEQLRLAPSIDKAKRVELEMAEESTVFSQAIHFANRIVFFRVPLDIVSNKGHQLHMPDRENNSTSMTASVAETDSMTVESGFDEQEFGSIGQEVIKFVSRFVDQVCTDSQVSLSHVRQLHQMIPGIVAMHIETIEAVSRESKRLPPLKKPKILTPTLLSGEEMSVEPLRVFLLPDGRDEMTGLMGGPALLPAEGALFVTNYRVIFKGCPCDAYASEIPVVRCLPISTIVKEKRISVNYLVHLDHWLHDGLQIRSNTFQLLKVAFDGDIGGEFIERLRKIIQRLRAPPTAMGLFAFRGQHFVSTSASVKDKEKQASIRGLAKKTLLRTARKAGIKTKSSKQHSFLLDVNSAFSDHSQSWNDGGSLESLDVGLQEHDAVLGDTGSIGSYASNRNLASTSAPALEAVSMERLLSRSYYSDWCRMGISRLPISLSGSGRFDPCESASSLSGTLPPTLQRTDTFSISLCNSSYGVCRSYPALLPTPSTVLDSSLSKVARCYRHNRLPVVTWRHPSSRALLLRGASSCSKGVRGIILAHQTAGSSNDASMVLEQERYIASLVAASSSTSAKHMSDSSLSINSLVLQAASDSCADNSCDPALSVVSSATRPRAINPASTVLNKTLQSLRIGNEAGSVSRMGTIGRNPHKLLAHLPSSMTLDPHNSRSRGISSTGKVDRGRKSQAPGSAPQNAHKVDAANTFQKASLYIFTGKSHSKIDAFPHTEIIPIEFADVKHVKTSFKKLLRACVPSSPLQDGSQTFLRGIEASEWLPQLQSIMRVAGAVVDLIDVQASSVVLCFEDGWDFTAQVSSIAQICLDCYYRSIEGFRVLVEKEWLSFGHRFSHRSNMTHQSIASGFAPIFLQFLDVVHQIQCQFPLSFEFNEYYLRLLAYHAVSARFRDFLLDTELERLETGLLAQQDNRRIARQSGCSAEGLSTLDSKLAALNNCRRTQWFDTSLTEVDEDTMSIDSINSTDRGSAVSTLPPRTYVGPRFSVPTNILSSSSHFHSRGCTGPQQQQSHHLGQKLLQPAHIQSVFDYIDRHAARSPLFHNVHHISTATSAGCEISPAVLRPCFSLSVLRVWRFYCHETLATGPSFDLEAVAVDDRRRREEVEQSAGVQPVGNTRRSITAGYSGHLNQDQCSILLEDYRRLQLELGNLTERWRSVWLKQNALSSSLLCRRTLPLHVRLRRNCSRYAHKRSTIQLIMRGSVTSSSSLSNGVAACSTSGASDSISSAVPFLSLHRFEKCNYSAPTHCDHCRQVLWGLVKNGVRCADCGLNVHEKCADNVHASCNKSCTISHSNDDSVPNDTALRKLDCVEQLQERAVKGSEEVYISSLEFSSGQANSSGNLSEQVPCDRRLPDHHQPLGQQQSSQHQQRRHRQEQHDQSIFHHFPSHSSEHRTLEGYLYKRGVLLKSWKQRWFVLDSVKHELRYYDGMEDQHCKGSISLADVVSVCSVAPMPAAPKRVDEKSFFELKTTRRVYNFCANDSQSAQEWVEKIQSCLQ